MLEIDIRPAFGWQRTLVVSNPFIELIVTLDVGPRIISYRKRDGKNVFKTFTEELGRSGEASWRSRGGHRLWVAPESSATYYPDNQPIALDETPAGFVLTAPVESGNFVTKSMTLSVAADSSRVSLRHTIKAEQDLAQPIAAWAITVMREGGRAEIPMPSAQQHPDETDNPAPSDADFLPNRSIALWPYTNPADSRFDWQADRLVINQSAAGPATKLGLLHHLGSVSYLVGDDRFSKTISFETGAAYPDRHCNLEVFTNREMLELESLGPMTRLRRGESVVHEEHWTLD